MSDVERARAGYAAFASGELEELAKWFNPHIEWVEPPELPGARSYRGRERVLEYLESIRRVWEEFDVQPQAIDETDDGVLVDVLIRARARGVDVEDRVLHRVTVEDGQATRITVHRRDATG